MTEMSRERREELEHYADLCSTEGVVQVPGDELRALLSDSAWRERVEKERGDD